MNDLSPSTVEVDALFLSNSAEVQNGLAYILGAGWTRCWPAGNQDYPVERPLAITMMFRVPWNETNVEHTFRVSIKDDDGREVVPPVTGAFKAGRPPDLTDGASQLVVVNFGAKAKIERPGLYHIAVEVNDVVRRTIQFEAIPKPGSRPVAQR
ncbi:MAG: hypothetical protein WD557_18225 [Dehalococcoidia bacterium]